MKRRPPQNRGPNGHRRAAASDQRPQRQPRDRLTRDSSVVELPQALEGALLQGHPWVYREQIPSHFDATSGQFVEVRCGRFVGFGLWDADSPLSVRVFSRSQMPDRAWFSARLVQAWELRAGIREQQTDAFRWVHGEGDSLPGIVVDHYAGHAVITYDSDAYLELAKSLAPELQECARLKSVLLRHRGRSGDTRVEALVGSIPRGELIVVENGIRFRVDLCHGQKTGLFLDHRDNRKSLECHAAGRRVLNLFAYSGAFSMYALRGGAERAVDVDVAKGAALDARQNVQLNGFDADRHEFVVEDVFEYLEAARKRGETFDLIICDPPTFARSKSHLDKALKAYERVNAAALKLAADGALFAAASCTARVSPAAFKTSIARAARRAKRRFVVVEERGQPADHPELVGHPEGRYLKFVLGRVQSYV